MSRSSLALKLCLPSLFFGYAIAANVALFAGDTLTLSQSDLTKGGITAEIDETYRAHLLHKDPSVGVVGAMRYALLGEGRDGVVVGEDGWLYTAEEFRFADDAPKSIDDTVAGMAAIGAALAAQGTSLLVLPLPSKLETEKGRAPDQGTVARSEAEYDRFLAALSEQGIAFFDSRPVFEAAAPDGAFLKTDTHWTPETAARLAQALAGSGDIPGGDETFSKVSASPVTFSGDLVAFITSEQLAPLVGLRPETVVPWVAEPVQLDGATLDLFGDSDAADLVLVGTSYSANPNWSFAEALKVALGRDVLNLAQEGRGPVKPMLDFMAETFPTFDTPPEFVIWEVPARYLADPTLWPETTAENGDV